MANGAITTAVAGGSLGDNLAGGLVSQAANVTAAVGFNFVGSYAEQQFEAARLAWDSAGMAMWAEGGAGRVAMHALMGGAVSAGIGGDFISGAVAAGASQAMAGVLNDAFEKQPELREAFAQIVGLASAGLAGADYEKGAWVAQMADQYNRQAHPEEVRLIKEQAQALATEQNISVAEAERRMAQAFAYYTDKKWQELLTKDGLVIDSSTMTHLAKALTPLANRYDVNEVVVTGDVPVVTEQKPYTADRTLALLQGYAANHNESFSDPKINSELLGSWKPDAWDEYKQYYDRNLTLNTEKQPLGFGAFEGVGSQLTKTAEGLYSLGNGLIYDPEGTTRGVLHGLASTDPFDWGYQKANGLAELYRLQGDFDAAAKVEMEWKTGLALTLIPAGRVGKIATDLAIAAEFKALQESAWKASLRPCCFAAGTLVATPSGDRAIETIKVGDVVWTKPEQGGEPLPAAVLATHFRNHQPIYKLTLESTRADGKVKREDVMVTPSHPFYVLAQRAFVPMSDLRIGDLLQSLGDGAGEGTSSRVASVALFKPVGETFNLTVDVGHTFYVGELKTWVHNTGPCDINGGPKSTGSAVVDGAGSGVKGTGQALREVEVSSGGKGAWTKELNKPEPNTIYKVDGNKTYQTDSFGRVDKVESNLSLTRNDRNTYQQCVAGKCGVSGDEGGHLIASVFNGAGERLNLLPMNGNLNKGAWKAMENTWASALKQGQTVGVKIEPVYSGASVRPDRFIVRYSIDGGRPVIVDFKNSPGGI